MYALLLPLALAAPDTAMHVSTPAFSAGEAIPQRHTCDGEDLSPALEWRGAPDDTASFAVIVDDPDAPGRTWVHWLVWNLPPTTTSLPEGIEPNDPRYTQGTTDFRRVGWGGPCPPKGHGTHRYYFRVYALDRTLHLPTTTTRAELDTAMKGHILATGDWMGTYHRGK